MGRRNRGRGRHRVTTGDKETNRWHNRDDLQLCECAPCLLSSVLHFPIILKSCACRDPVIGATHPISFLGHPYCLFSDRVVREPRAVPDPPISSSDVSKSLNPPSPVSNRRIEIQTDVCRRFLLRTLQPTFADVLAGDRPR